MCTDEDDAAALARADSGAIEPHSGPVDEDEFDPVDGWDASSSGSTSVTPSVYDHEYAHGRRYHSYRNGRYPIPNDNIEQNREDMKHAMMLELTVCFLLSLFPQSSPRFAAWPVSAFD